MSDRTVADTIAKQLGGYGRLSAMVGAHSMTYDGTSLRFKFKGSRNKVNHIKIELNGKDLYDIEFGWVWGTKFTVKETFNDVYADKLIELFESTTGLYLSL